MSKSHKGLIVQRLTETTIYLSEPCTIKELAEHFGIFPSCAYSYIAGLQRGGYPVKSRIRPVHRPGHKPLEYWIEWVDPIIREALMAILRLRGM